MKQVIAIIVTAFSLLSVHANAQLITGTVSNDNNEPLSFATIQLRVVKDSSLVKTIMSDSTGRYQFTKVNLGHYLVSASMTGYNEAFTKPVIVDGKTTIQLPVKLHKQAASLQGVTVTSRKPFIERKLDRTIMNIENSAIAAGSTAMEVLEKAPGVIVDKDGNISMAGKAGVQLMIDGKPTYMSSNDLAQLLRSMQASQVELIELITNPSAKYDAAGNAGIINIKTKKNKTFGTNGNMNVSAGYSDYTKTNAAINLNHRNKYLNVFGNYYYGNNNNGRLLNIDRVAVLQNTPSYFSQHMSEDKNWKNNNVKLGADYFINSKQTLGVLITGYRNAGASTSNNTTAVSNSRKIVDSTIVVNGKNTSNYRNIAVNHN